MPIKGRKLLDIKAMSKENRMKGTKPFTCLHRINGPCNITDFYIESVSQQLPYPVSVEVRIQVICGEIQFNRLITIFKSVPIGIKGQFTHEVVGAMQITPPIEVLPDETAELLYLCAGSDLVKIEGEMECTPVLCADIQS